jgi:hypothetical protein
LGLNLAVILDLKDFARIVESDAIVILDASISLVSKHDLAVGKAVD